MLAQATCEYGSSITLAVHRWLLLVNTMLKETFKNEKIWVNWKYKTVNGKKTKIPYSITGLPASSTDSFTWSFYDDAKNASDQIGIIFSPEKKLLGIDLDGCIVDGKIVDEKIMEFLLEADTYTEYSPSGKGLHLFLKIEEPLDLISNKKVIGEKKAYEVYTSGRYFTVTEKPYKEEKEVRIVSKEEALRLIEILGYPWNATPKKENIISTPTNLSDDELLQKMFSSKTGTKIKSLYDGDTSAFNGDESSADMALCSHLAFWTGNNSSQMERIWSSSPLGQREKTQKRKDYRDRTIQHAISSCTEVYTPVKKINTPLEFLTTVVGKFERPTLCIENICRILRQTDNYRFDEFKILHQIKKNNEWKELEISDAIRLQVEISIKYDFFQKVGKDMVYDALLQVCKENSYDSASDYLKNLVWDRKSRLDTWLHDAYGVHQMDYYRAVGSNWLKGLVKRIIYPGSKFDYVIVLEGKQGLRKSTSLYELGRSWHVETTMSTDSKDFFMLFQGKAIIEFSEGETLSKTEVKRMKAIITMQFDKYRMPYERVSKEFPRRCVFAMTTNESNYLKDDTGNRRWLPVACQKCDIDWIKENREQLLAEAYYRAIILKETTWEFPEEETLAMQNERRILDPNSELIVDWYINVLGTSLKEDGITVHEAYFQAVNKGQPFTKPISQYEMNAIGSIFRDVLFLDKQRVMKNNARTVRWFPTDKTPKKFEDQFNDFKVEEYELNG